MILEKYSKNDISIQDVINLGYRKNQLEVFRKLLFDNEFIQEEKQNWE